MRCKVSCLWEEASLARAYSTAISLHGHTNHSKESLSFIPEYAERWGITRLLWGMAAKKSMNEGATKLDFSDAYWTPPLPPLGAYRVEREQIERKLGLESMISLTDHDNIEAPMHLRVIPEARRIPVSFEWSVPFRDTVLHLGIHNLPSAEAQTIFERLNAYTKDPRETRLPELLEMLHEKREVLTILNHPMWDMAEIGKVRHIQTLSAFAAELGMFIHALELGGLRSWEENQEVVHFAEGWNLPITGGGDRHGCEASGVLNLSQAESFTEFVHEIREERRSHVVFMPQYREPLGVRMAQTFLDAVREYPDYPIGSRQWDERVFHLDFAGQIRPVANLWTKPPWFFPAVFSSVGLLEWEPVRSAMHLALAKPEREMRFVLRGRQEVLP